MIRSGFISHFVSKRLLPAILILLLVGSVCLFADSASVTSLMEEAAAVTALAETGQPAAENDFLSYEEPVPIEAPDSLPLLIKTIISLVIISSLIYLTVYLFKYVGDSRKASGLGGKLIKTLDVLHLTPGRTVYLLEVADKVIVVGATDSSLNLLSEITDSEAVARLKEKGGKAFKKPIRFKEQLAKFSGSANQVE